MADRVVTTFYGALHVLISGLLDKYPRKKIFFITPTHTVGDTIPNPTTNKTLEEYVNIIKEVCRYYSIPILDLFNESWLNPNYANTKARFYSDTIHLNIHAHIGVGDLLATFIENH